MVGPFLRPYQSIGEGAAGHQTSQGKPHKGRESLTNSKQSCSLQSMIDRY